MQRRLQFAQQWRRLCARSVDPLEDDRLSLSPQQFGDTGAGERPQRAQPEHAEPQLGRRAQVVGDRFGGLYRRTLGYQEHGCVLGPESGHAMVHAPGELGEAGAGVLQCLGQVVADEDMIGNTTQAPHGRCLDTAQTDRAVVVVPGGHPATLLTEQYLLRRRRRRKAVVRVAQIAA